MRQKKFYFDASLAVEHGMREAVIYEYIRFWCDKNSKTGHNKRDGHYWTYGSSRELSKAIPFLTPKQIWLGIKSLQRQDLIVIGIGFPIWENQYQLIYINNYTKSYILF